MRIQLLSDLHLETEEFQPRPAPGAELLVLAGDIDSSWVAFELFRDWPVPVLMVAGNHEFDDRELGTAWAELRARCADCGITLLERQSTVLRGEDGRRIRFVGTIRWSDFDLFGEPGRERAVRAARYFMQIMNATRGHQPFDATGMREESLACLRWLEAELARGNPGAGEGGWDATVVITHFAPSLKSADPRYGAAPGTASFCNADDDLLARCDAWLHGHLHCRHDYSVARAGARPTRVISQARGLGKKGEHEGFDPLAVFTL